MPTDDRAVLAMLEQSVLGSDTSTTMLLQQCIVLGGRAGSTALRDWATKELRGYGPDEELPAHRRVPAAMQADGQVGLNLFRGQPIGLEDLPEEAREAGITNELALRQGLGELEAMARSGESTTFARSGGTQIVKMMNRNLDEFEQIHKLYWVISNAAMQGVVDQVRTSVAELVCELLASLPTDDGDPSKQAADQAVNYVVSGNRNTVTIANAQVAGGGGTSSIRPPAPQQQDSWWMRSRKRGVVIGLATIASALIAAASLDFSRGSQGGLG
jgi:hypothetical protein